MRLHPVADGSLPATLPMGTPDAAYHLATHGRPLPVGLLFRYDGPAPALDVVRARVAERAHRIPALRYRVASDGKVFRRVDRIEVEQHVREVRLPEDGPDGSGAGRLMLTRPMSTAERPPWEVWLVHGAGGGHTLCYRTDHTLQDGVGAAHTVRALLDDRPEGGPAPHHRSRPTARGLAAALGDVAASFGPPTAKPAFDLPGCGRTAVCHVDTPLVRLRGIGRAHGGTVNDVYLAALSHAFRTWHLKATGSPHPPGPLPVAVPMSVRAPGEECAPGNRMVVARLLLPCDEPSPLRALARVTARTSRMRVSRQRDVLSLLLAATPRAVGARVGTRMVNGAVVAAPTSSVNFGPALVHQGAVARRAALLTGLAAGIRCMTTLTSQHDVACLTIVHDEALATADALPDLWLTALRELERA
ncbi:wax ester/triacylglycerol synthase domain-containing protein [Streptomyces sp. NPDC005263]|uniref:wax ester/triacylglycerol synthase domain-containing protein n=1 Tax=Streptomyces sp. NPDC005263 TaxID=3364711 RepID=UPI003692CCDD